MNDNTPNIPPHNIEAEMAVLGAMMLGDREAIESAADILTRDDFYRDAHGYIFATITAMNGRSEPADIVTLKDELTRLGILEGIGGVRYLMHLGDIAFTTANIVHYAKIVLEDAISRRLVIAAETIRQRAYSREAGSATDKLAHAEQSVFNCAGPKLSSASANWQGLPELLSAVWDDIDQMHRAGGALSGVSTGLKAVDAITHGLRRGALVTLAARPGMGKTSAATSIAVSVAKQDQAVAVFSCEMSAKQLMQRIWASEAGVPFRRLESGTWTADECLRLMRAQETLYKKPLFIEDDSQISITALASRARRLHARQRLSLIVVDYIQYLEGAEGRRYTSEREKIMDIVKGLKQIARDLDVPVLALSQVSRNLERREDKRPILSDLAETGRIEAESDLVVFLYRPSYYEATEPVCEDDQRPTSATEASEEVEFIVAKNRNGPTKFVRIAFEPKLMRFSDLAPNGSW